MFWQRQSYTRDLPGLSVRRGALRSHLRTVTIAWMFGIIWVTAMTGTHGTMFFRMIGFGDLAFGISMAIPCIAATTQLLSAMMIEHASGLTKWQFFFFGIVNRFLWIPIAILPLLLPGPAVPVVVLALGLRLCSSICGQMSQPAWLTWMGRMIPPRIRGRYMARRAIWATIIAIVVAFAFGYLLDRFGIKGTGDDFIPTVAQKWLLCGIVAFGGLCGIVDILLFVRVPEVMPTVPEHKEEAHLRPIKSAGMHELLWEPLQNPEFRGYLLYATVILMGQLIAGSFFILNVQKNLGLDHKQVNFAFQILPSLTGIIASFFIGTLIDRWGRKPMLFVCTTGTLLSILPWFVLTERSEGLFFWSCIPGAIAGFTWAGILQAQLNITMRFADGDGQSRYIAAFYCLISIGGATAAILGGVIAESLEFMNFEHPFRIGPFEWNNWHVVMAISWWLLLIALLLLFRLHDPGAYPTREMLRHIRISTMSALTFGVLGNVRHRIWWRRPQVDLSESPTDTGDVM